LVRVIAGQPYAVPPDRALIVQQIGLASNPGQVATVVTLKLNGTPVQQSYVGQPYSGSTPGYLEALGGVVALPGSIVEISGGSGQPVAYGVLVNLP
jgi:hypothetical protein